MFLTGTSQLKSAISGFGVSPQEGPAYSNGTCRVVLYNAMSTDYTDVQSNRSTLSASVTCDFVGTQKRHLNFTLQFFRFGCFFEIDMPGSIYVVRQSNNVLRYGLLVGLIQPEYVRH